MEAESRIYREVFDAVYMIPRITHQIWIGGTPSEFLQLCRQTIINMHPGWEHMYHTDTSILDHPDLIDLRQQLHAFKAVCETCNGIHNPLALVADLCRLAIVYVHGGIYLDHDMYCVRALEPILGGDLVIAKIRNNYIGEGIIGAPRHSPKIKRVLEAFIKSLPGPNRNVCMNLTGIAASEGWYGYPSEYFCPHNKRGVVGPWGGNQYALYAYTAETYTIHCWRGLNYDVKTLEKVVLDIKNGIVESKPKISSPVYTSTIKPTRITPPITAKPMRLAPRPATPVVVKKINPFYKLGNKRR